MHPLGTGTNVRYVPTQAANILGVNTKTIKIMVRNGVLKPYSSQAKDLGSKYKFAPEMVQKFKDRNLDLLDLISAAKAAIAVGVDHNHFNNVWVKTKILRPLMRDGKFGKQYFSLREVQRLAKYNAEVIGSSEAGKILSISRVEIVKMTKAGNLRSVSRSNNDGLETHYKYLRSDVEKYKRKRMGNSL